MKREYAPTPGANPPVPTEGLGELLRAHRLYIGLSKDGMARALGMNDQSYERMESGKRPVVTGLLDSIDAVVDKFEAEVDKSITAASAISSSKRCPIRIEVYGDIEHEWERLVVSRAAVESELITPVLMP